MVGQKTRPVLTDIWPTWQVHISLYIIFLLLSADFVSFFSFSFFARPPNTRSSHRPHWNSYTKNLNGVGSNMTDDTHTHAHMYEPAPMRWPVHIYTNRKQVFEVLCENQINPAGLYSLCLCRLPVETKQTQTFLFHFKIWENICEMSPGVFIHFTEQCMYSSWGFFVCFLKYLMYFSSTICYLLISASLTLSLIKYFPMFYKVEPLIFVRVFNCISQGPCPCSSLALHVCTYVY